MANPNTAPWNIVVETFAELPAVANALAGYLAFVNESQTGYYLHIDYTGPAPVRSWKPIASGSIGPAYFSGTLGAGVTRYLGNDPGSVSTTEIKYTPSVRGELRRAKIRPTANTLDVITTVNLRRNGVTVGTTTIAAGSTALITIPLDPAVIFDGLTDYLDVQIVTPAGNGSLSLSVVLA